MKSRMEKYYKDDDKLQRTTRNDSLYEELYREKCVPRSNVTVIDNANEIDIAKIKEIVSDREKYRNMKKYEDLLNRNEVKNEKAVKYEFDEIDDNNYDINKILEDKRCNRVHSEEKVRKLGNTQYDILKSLVVEREKEEETATDFMTQEKNLKDLMNTIVNGKEVNDATDLFANLREEDVDKEKDDETFYTSSTQFDNEDFSSDIESSNTSKVFIVIAIIAILVAAGIFIWFKFFK